MTDTNSGPWYSRGYLPHFDAGSTPQFLTFRLRDSLPRGIAASPGVRPATVERVLDEGHGACFLSDPRIAEIVRRALLHFRGERYELHAWVIMPNHVHALATIESGHSLAEILHSWKSFSATRVNRALRRSGRFWQREYFDRFIRDETHFASVKEYIEENPVTARLCERKEQWVFGSAYEVPSS